MPRQEFFGKVKNKAGDMEKILKEKDKHGLINSSTMENARRV